jgi:MPBQ/MSBQ methyltransferase
MQVYDVGGGTGFTTLGIVEHVKPENITMIDQSPHQLAKAKAKPALDKVTKLEVRVHHACPFVACDRDS